MSRPGITSAFKSLFVKEDPGTPAKEMNLGRLGVQKYDKEKKRWVFEGETPEEEQEILPPPKAFTQSQPLQQGIKRKMYVDVLGSSNDKPYVPANFEGKVEAIEKFWAKEDEFHRVDDFAVSDAKDSKEDMSYDVLQAEDFKCESEENKNSEKYKDKIEKLKKKQQELIEFCEEFGGNETEFMRICLEVNRENLYEENWECFRVEVEDQLRQRLMQLENEVFIWKSREAVKKCKCKKLKKVIIEKDAEIEQRVGKAKELEEDILRLESVIERKDKDIAHKDFYKKNQDELIEEKNEEIKRLSAKIEDYFEAMTKKEKEMDSRTRYLEKLRAESEVEAAKLKVAAQVYWKIYEECAWKIREMEVDRLSDREELRIAKTENGEIKQKDPIEPRTERNIIGYIQSLQTSKEEMQSTIDEMLEDYKNLKRKHDVELEREKADAQTQIEKLQNELNNERMLIDQIKSQILLFKKESYEKEGKIKRLKHNFDAEIHRLNSLIEIKSQKIKKLAEEKTLVILEKNMIIEELHNKVEEASENQLIRLELARTSEEYNKTKAKYKHLKENAKNKAKDIEDLQRISENLHIDLENKENELKELKDQEKILLNEILQLKSELAPLSLKENELLTQINDLGREITTLQSKLASCESENDSLSINLTNHKTNLLDITSKLAVANQSIESLTTELQSTMTSVSHLTSDLSEAKHSIILLTSELSEANNSISMLSSDLSSANDSISLLSSENEKIPSYLEALQTLTQKSLDTEAEYEELQESFTQNSLLITQLNDRISSMSARLETLNTSNLELQYENAELLEQITALNTQITNVTEELVIIKEELHSTSLINSELNDDIYHKDHEIKEYRKQLEQKTHELHLSQQEVKDHEAKQSDIIQAHEDNITRLLNDSNLQLLKQKAELSELNSKIITKTEEFSLDEKKSNYDLEIQISELNEQLKSKEILIKNLQSKAKDKSMIVGKKTQEPAEVLENENKRLRESESKLKAEVSDLNDDVENLYEKILGLQQKIQSLNWLEETVKIKDSEIQKILIRLKEKDEELLLAKRLYQDLMSTHPEAYVVPDSIILDPSPVETLEPPPSPLDQTSSSAPIQSEGWLASILSAVFLTDSERTSK